MSHRNRVAPGKLDQARELRRNMTPCEQVIWEQVRKTRLGVRARRQAIILGWIVDFYFPSRKLVVEIDGECPHPRSATKDASLRAKGFTVLHFTNDDVIRRKAWVIGQIRAAL